MSLSKFAIAVLSIGLAACGGSSSSSSNSGGGTTAPKPIEQGRLIDSPVKGAGFVSSSSISGLTNVNGVFSYRQGDTVSFRLGGLSLGSAQGAAIITLLDLVDGARAAANSGSSTDEVLDDFPAIVNLARLLQSLDVDGDSGNGIQIPSEAAQKVSAYVNSIDFTDPDMFADSDKPAVKFICEVKAARGIPACSESNIVDEDAARSEVKDTEERRRTGNINELPIVSAGADLIVAEAGSVTLQGSAQDNDGNVTGTLWQQTDRNGVAINGGIEINNPGSLTASFTAPEVDQDRIFYFSLTATDNDGDRASDTVAVLVRDSSGGGNARPVANAGVDQNVESGEVVVLDGSNSEDLDGQITSYSWSQIDEDGNSVGNGVALQNGDTAEASFTAPSVEVITQLRFRLTVSDNESATDFDDITINVSPEDTEPENVSPVANAGDDQNAIAGESVTLDASASSDADGDELSYSWEQTDDTDIQLTGADTKVASFTAPDVSELRTLTFKVTVSDGALSADDHVSVVVAPAPAVCDPTDPGTYQQCFAICTDGDPDTECPLPYEDFSPNPEQFEEVFSQLQACADQNPDTVCPLPIESLPGGEDPGACDATNPASYSACFADCTDGDANTDCPLPYEDFAPSPDQFEEVLNQLQACADQDPDTVCPLPIENLPGGEDPGACDATNPASYSACFADCTDGDANTDCPLPYEDFSPNLEQFEEVLNQLQACADQNPDTVCPLPIESLPGGEDPGACDATNPASYSACFADCTDGDANTDCPLPYEDFSPNPEQFEEVLNQLQACADQNPDTVCPLPIESLPGGEDPGACDATNPASYSACFADCTDGDANTDCPLPYEDFSPNPEQFEEVLNQLQACADQNPDTVCPLPIENLPGGEHPGACDATNPASYSACFADCTDGDANTDCPLPYEDFAPSPDQFEEVLNQLQACADQNPDTVCPLPVDNLPGGEDPGACDATNPASYSACFADCTDGDASTDCPLPYEDFAPSPDQFEEVLNQLQACADQNPDTVCPLPIENLPGGEDPGACDATNPASYSACFADCTDGDAGTDCPLPYEDFTPNPEQFEEVLNQLQACADQNPDTVCPLPIENLPGGEDPGACDATNPASYSACFADCTDGDAGTDCPLPYEDFTPNPEQFEEVLNQLGACADQDPDTVCPLPIENLPGGEDPGACDATNPASYSACFADCTDGDAGTDCPLPYEDFAPSPDQFEEVLNQLQACADQDPDTVCPLPIENLPGGEDPGACDATNPASYSACFADCTDGDANTDCPLPYEDFAPSPDQFEEVLNQLQACADQDPDTVCPLPIESLPGGEDPGACDATNPASYSACFADCTDGDANTDCPLPYEDFSPNPEQFEEVLNQLQACADQNPDTVCPLPIENLPGGEDPGACDATNPASYSACFADCTDGDANTDCPLPYEDFAPSPDQFEEVLDQLGACADQDPDTVCPLPIENLPGGEDPGACDATNPASYSACFADCTDGDANTDCPLPYEDFSPNPEQFEEVLNQLQACADQNPDTVCPLPIENLPGGEDPGACDATNPASYSACFADCTDGDASTDCPLPVEDLAPSGDTFNEVLSQLGACADPNSADECLFTGFF